MPKFKEVEQGAGKMDWADDRTVEKTIEAPGEVLTKPGRHPLAGRAKHFAEEERERQAKHLRDFGGRERDARRVPNAAQVDSGRTWKSSSQIRFPSRAFRENYEKVFKGG